MKAAQENLKALYLNKSKIEPKTVGDKIIWLLTTVLLSCFLILSSNEYITYILIGITGLILLMMLFRYNFRFPVTIGRFHYYILAFAVYCGISSIWAINGAASIEKAITIAEILVCMSVLYCHYARKNSVFELLECVRWAGYTVTIYAILFYGLDTIRATLAIGERLDNSFANINSIAMASSISLVLTIYKLFFYKFSISSIISIFEIILIAASESRKALFIVLMGVVLVLLFRFSSRNLLKTLLRYLAIAVALIGLLYLVFQLPIFSGILERTDGLIALITGEGEVDHSAWLRQQYIIAGFDQFRETPIFGIGIANSNYITVTVAGLSTYLHNNFIELLACGGIIGFLIYYSMFLWPLYKMWKGRKQGDFCTSAVIILLVILLVIDYGAVSYYSKSTYFYFMIFFLQVDLLSRNSKRFTVLLNV